MSRVFNVGSSVVISHGTHFRFCIITPRRRYSATYRTALTWLMNGTRDWGKNRFPRLFSYCGCVFTTFSSVSFKMLVSLVRDYWTKQISGIFSPFRYRKLAFCRVRPTKHGIKWQWGTGIADCRLDNWNRGHLIMFSGRTMRVNPIITRHIGTKVLSALLVTYRGHGARLGSTNKSTHEIIAQRSAVHYIIGASFMLFAVQTAGLRKHCAFFFSFSESPVRFDLVPCVPRRIIKSFFVTPERP